VIAFNAEVLQILTFANQPENMTDLDTWLAYKVHGNLLDKQSSSGFASELRFGEEDTPLSLIFVTKERHS
jgi:hypothetical protein